MHDECAIGLNGPDRANPDDDAPPRNESRKNFPNNFVDSLPPSVILVDVRCVS
jgi:hypothetical protein